MNPSKLFLLLIIVLLSISYSLAGVVSRPGESIPNYPGYNSKNANDIKIALEDLEYSDIFDKGRDSIIAEGNIRIDRDGIHSISAYKWYILEANIDGVDGELTIARVQVYEKLQTNDAAKQTKITSLVVNAIKNSYKTGKIYIIFDNSL
ncbi:hypothetical protein ACTFIW_010211 [Dictyostelium discoideum]